MQWREYDPARDCEAVRRIWQEIGWIEPENERDAQAMDMLVGCGQALVAEVAGEPECLVITAPGVMRYGYGVVDLDACCVTGVSTSRVARKKGLAKRLTARAIARAAAEGAQVAILWMFEQGFYNALGFGNGAYVHFWSIDPADLRVPVRARPPQRLTSEDWEKVHAARLARYRRHGGCSLLPPEVTRSGMLEGGAKGFGLGYLDSDGRVTHHIWFHPQKVENGPYSVEWMSYRTGDELLELMALIHDLGDQVDLIRMAEPPGIQIQDWLDRPIKRRRVSRRSDFEQGCWAGTGWQVRICDLPGCLARTSLPGETIRFNLRLHDPIGAYLDEEDLPWRGVGGDYVVTLGPTSSAEVGVDPALPTLEASVGAFTRMWLGVRPATGLAVSDELHGPPELLAQLDRAITLPVPHLDWFF